MLATQRWTIAKCLRAFITITKQAMPFGDHLSLKSESDFSNILSLNIDWQFCHLLSLKQKRQNLVAFTGLEGVNNVFSHMFLLFQSLLSEFLINCYLLLSQRRYFVHAPPCFWYRTQGFLKSKTLVEPGSSSTTGMFSPFRTLRKSSAMHVRSTEHDSYLSFSQKSSS